MQTQTKLIDVFASIIMYIEYIDYFGCLLALKSLSFVKIWCNLSYELNAYNTL